MKGLILTYLLIIGFLIEFLIIYITHSLWFYIGYKIGKNSKKD